jgi:hypothetical protein
VNTEDDLPDQMQVRMHKRERMLASGRLLPCPLPVRSAAHPHPEGDP